MAGGFGPSKGRKESANFNCLATGPGSRPEVQAVHPYQNHYSQFLKHECESITLGGRQK